MKENIKLEKYELYKLIDCLPMPMITDEDLEKEIKEGRKLILFGKERKVEQVPENIQDVKEILDKAKIKYELFYVNDKDYRWTINDKVKILRAIVIRFKTKFDDVYTEYSVTIDNNNRIVIHKYKYEGSESIRMQLSTMEQVWNMFVNLYKDVVKEK